MVLTTQNGETELERDARLRAAGYMWAQIDGPQGPDRSTSLLADSLPGFTWLRYEPRTTWAQVYFFGSPLRRRG